MNLMIVALITICSATDYIIYLANKKADADYGERLSSVENPDTERLRLSGRNQMTRSTRCSTGQPITMDPYYIPTSDEEDNKKEEVPADTTNNSVAEENVPRKTYEPPPSVKNPDHYIDDD